LLNGGVAQTGTVRKSAQSSDFRRGADRGKF
jgi:hypothetical protein